MPARTPDPALLPDEALPTAHPGRTQEPTSEARERGPDYRARWQIPTDPPPV